MVPDRKEFGVAEAAKIVGRSKQLLRYELAVGRLRYRMTPYGRVIPRAALFEYLADRERRGLAVPVPA